jgi:hypothetical protein
MGDIKNSEASREKRILTFLFWCLAIFIFAAFLRLFWILFHFVYGTMLVWILGKKFEGVVAALAFITALIFSIATFRHIYLQFKKHIIDG